MSRLDLGLTDVQSLPGIAGDPERWQQLCRRMNQRVFLRSEGSLIEVGAPQSISGQLLEQATEVVTRINRFYRGVASAYYTHPELRSEYLLNPLLEPLLELEADQPSTTPLSRLDAVLCADGSIRVIEINAVGICLFHMRGLYYLIRELWKGGFEDDARRLDEMSRDMVVKGFLQFARTRLASMPARPVIGALTPSGWFRAGSLLFRAAFERAGCDYVFGGPEHLEVSDAELRLRGTRIDILWADFFLYIAYQNSRYQQTRFPSKVPEYGQTPGQAAALLADRRFLSHLRTGRVALISPARSYLALPKALLSWIHRTDRPVPDQDRAFLAEHVARTYSSRDRADRLVTIDEVIKNRGEFLVKPCQYGGSHGVLIGRSVESEAWRAKVVEIWDDPTWALQAFHEPVRASTGEWVSLGLANFDGALGGAYLRTSPSLLINARDAAFIPAVVGL